MRPTTPRKPDATPPATAQPYWLRPVPLGIETVALEPALDLLAHAAEIGGDLADVAAIEQRDQLVASRSRTLRGVCVYEKPR